MWSRPRSLRRRSTTTLTTSCKALTSSLEAIEAYETYQEDGGGDLFGRLLEDERSHAQLLLDELRACLGDTNGGG